jgi:hypothetical protein
MRATCNFAITPTSVRKIKVYSLQNRSRKAVNYQTPNTREERIKCNIEIKA